MTPKITTHGGGKRGIPGCHCTLCRDRSNRWTREFRSLGAPMTTPRRLAEWELWDATPTRMELLAIRGAQ